MENPNDRKAAPKAAADAQPAGYYHSQKDRIFVRAIQGEYNLDWELKRLRAMPRVRKASEIKFVDGPQAYSRPRIQLASATLPTI